MNNIRININEIIKKTIEEIDSSREQIVNIVDNLRNEHKIRVEALISIIANISIVIDEVEELERQDKKMRLKLVEVSKNFYSFSEEEAKNAYEKALDIRIEFMTKKTEEKVLREKRNRLELELKKSQLNIEDSEKVVNHIGIALGYLDGDNLSTLADKDKDSDMFIGIKILEAQENERRRIARDIHDGPAQNIASLIMKVDICKKVITNNLNAGLKELTDLKESVKLTLKEVRNIIFDLRPISLDDLSLNQTIVQTLEAITRDTDIDIKVKLRPIDHTIEAIIQVAIYRIFQEILNNIKKHSKAKHVKVILHYKEQYLILTISDDGVGFNVEETLARVKKKGGSYGLINILDRVNQLQGEINIASSIKSGTLYNVRLPINREVIKDVKRIG